jgi:DNA-binding beta-propeller fold protein YncE
MIRASLLPCAFAGALVLGLAFPAQDAGEIRLGTGDQTYRWVRGWAKLPAGTSLGNTHGCIVVDKADNVYVNTDTENAVIVFDRAGNHLRSFGKELAGGLHGMLLREEDGVEYIYATHVAQRVALKMTLAGEVLWTLGYPAESGFYEDPSQYHPTSIAVAPNGDLFVADGYGLSWIHVFDAERRYLRTFGGRGGLRGQFQTCHGIAIETWKGAPALLVADRENDRVQVLGLDGSVRAVLGGDLRRPCHVQWKDGALLLPGLAGLVSVLDGDGNVLATLGDQPDEGLRARNDVGLERWRDGEFLSPHCARWDSHGDLYVMDWNFLGRITKLERVR